jgi:hypothetical protein
VANRTAVLMSEDPSVRVLPLLREGAA